MSLAVLAQWLHLAAAAAAVGGGLYVRVVLMRSLKALPPEQGTLLLKAAARRFNPILWSAIGLLLVTGLYNLGAAVVGGVGDPLYWRILGLKVGLATLLFAFALGVTLPVPALAPLQRWRPQVLALNLALAAAVLFLSALLRRL